MTDDWVVVHAAANLPVAEMIREFLETEGIRAILRAPGLSPYIGVDVIEILVASRQEEEARLAISAFLEGTPGGLPGTEEPEGGTNSR